MKRLVLLAFALCSICGYSQTYKDFKVGDTVKNQNAPQLGPGVILSIIDTTSCKVKWFNGMTNTSYFTYLTPKHWNPVKPENTVPDSVVVRLLKKFDSLKVTYIELYCVPKGDVSTFLVGKNIRETFIIYIGLPFSETKLAFETSFKYPIDALNFVAKHGWHLASVFSVTLNNVDIRHYELEKAR